MSMGPKKGDSEDVKSYLKQEYLQDNPREEDINPEEELTHDESSNMAIAEKIINDFYKERKETGGFTRSEFKSYMITAISAALERAGRLPERKAKEAGIHMLETACNCGFNECLDEIARLRKD